MSDTNIDKFNDLAGKIFAELYEHFPIPYDLVAKKLATPTFTSEGNDLCLLELPASDADFFNATVRWLIGTGYLTGEICPDTQVSGAVLTLKGLEALKSTPHCLTHGLSIRQRLADEHFAYDPLNYLVVSVSMPISGRVKLHTRLATGLCRLPAAVRRRSRAPSIHAPPRLLARA